MLRPVLRELLRPSLVRLLEALGRGSGRTVAELSQELGASYMGVKQQCQKLVKQGFLEERRVPTQRGEPGRPRLRYRLKERAEELFGKGSEDLPRALMGEVERVFGRGAPERVIFSHLKHLEEGWAQALRGARDIGERTEKLRELREAEGWVEEVIFEPGKGLFLQVGCHPFGELLDCYPDVARYEQQMLERLLGRSLSRVENRSGKRGRVRYEVVGF